MIRLLESYKQYDYLNARAARPKVKILVSYIKPSFLFKTDILTPIHLGRAIEKQHSKDGAQCEASIKWLHENCIGDDDFEGNISKYNRRIGFFTGTYWAWKNYEKLGNPEYFGSFGYRKLLVPSALQHIDDYDLILPHKLAFATTLREQFIKHHGRALYDNMLKAVKETYPDEYDQVEEYLHGKEGYFMEMYIAKKKVFFEFCEWISKFLPCLLAKDYLGDENENIRPPINILLGVRDYRDIAFIWERLTGYYFSKVIKRKEIKYKEADLFDSEPYVVKLAAMAELLLKAGQKMGNGKVPCHNAYFISVVNDLELYKKCISENPFVINSQNNQFVCLDNTQENKPVPVLYNRFLDTYDYSKEAWFIFCHNDWELLQNIEPVLMELNKNNIYGPIGAKLGARGIKVFRTGRGFCYEQKRDGSKRKKAGVWTNQVMRADTVDCQCLIVHSSLVQKYNLRFDNNLSWHLYVEDFCINALLAHHIKTYTAGIACCHHSDVGFTEDTSKTPGYQQALAYFNSKYPNYLFAGTVSCLGGREYVECPYQEVIGDLLKDAKDLMKNNPPGRG